MKIRKYQIDDTQQIMDLFYDTVHAINSQDYTKEQVDAWAPRKMDYEKWKKRLISRVTNVAEEDGVIAGFAELQSNGHLDCFYCRKEFIGRGVGGLLLKSVEATARKLRAPALFAEVSITARPFFERRGFQLVKEQEVVVRGVSMKNYVMSKPMLMAQQMRKR